MFTKLDQFKIDLRTLVENEDHNPETELDPEVERIFNKDYLANLGRRPFVRLESEDFVNHLAYITLISSYVLQKRTPLADRVLSSLKKRRMLSAVCLPSGRTCGKISFLVVVQIAKKPWPKTDQLNCIAPREWDMRMTLAIYSRELLIRRHRTSTD